MGLNAWGPIRRHMRLAGPVKDLSCVSVIDTESEVAAGEVGLKEADREAIWRAVETLYRSGIHPGISLCIRRHGKLFMHRAIGHASGNGPGDSKDETPQVMRLDTPVCLFSASKAVTAILIHHLAESGQINLLDPVSHYLPEFARKGKQNITIHQILSHRGGIPGLPANEPLESLYDPDLVWQLLCDAKPIAVDGGVLAYHAITGGFVLEKVVEAVTGDSISAYLDRVFRQPMRMKTFTYGLEPRYRQSVARNYATGFATPFPISLAEKRALGVNMATAAEVTNGSHWMDASIPAGNMYATAEELNRFFEMLRLGGKSGRRRIIQPLTVQRAIQEYGSLSVDRTVLIPMRYSAGMMLGMDPIGLFGRHSGRAYGHLGLINKLAWVDPDRDISVAFLTTGLNLVGHHLPALVGVVKAISEHTQGPC